MATIRIEICENLENLLFFLSLPYVFTTSDDISNDVCDSYESFVNALSWSSVAGIATRLLAALSGFQNSSRARDNHLLQNREIISGVVSGG
jgi:hypothetical protein